jgi:hypothetical protein
MKNMMMLLLCAVSFTATAQEEKSKKHQWHNMKGQQQVMTRGAGMSFQQFDALNKRMAGFPQYKTLPGYMVTISGGSLSTYKNFVSQMSIGVGSSLTGNPDKRSSALRYLGGGIDFGYDLVPSEKIMLYPMAGIGFETYNARFYKNVSDVDFDAAVNSSTVQNSNRSVKFNNSFATYRLGLGLSLKPGKSTGSIGLQAGYVGSFKDRSWRTSENQTLANAPREGLGRFAISLVFTGGGMMCRK